MTVKQEESINPHTGELLHIKDGIESIKQEYFTIKDLWMVRKYLRMSAHEGDVLPREKSWL